MSSSLPPSLSLSSYLLLFLFSFFCPPPFLPTVLLFPLTSGSLPTTSIYQPRPPRVLRVNSASPHALLLLPLHPPFPFPSFLSPTFGTVAACLPVNVLSLPPPCSLSFFFPGWSSPSVISLAFHLERTLCHSLSFLILATSVLLSPLLVPLASCSFACLSRLFLPFAVRASHRALPLSVVEPTLPLSPLVPRRLLLECARVSSVSATLPDD